VSGFGIADAGAVMQEVEWRWRPQSFLHQLSGNGSLVWRENHDREWLAQLGRRLGRPDISWEQARQILARQPASMTRKALWEASAAWLEEMRRLYPRIAAWTLEAGIDPPAPLRQLEEEIALRGEQLERLEWCRRDDAKGRVRIIR